MAAFRPYLCIGWPHPAHGPSSQDKLAQLDAEKTRQRTIDLGMPTFSNLAGRTGSGPQPGFSAR
jgi:hypothetical protein